jgi:hypothetical protein
MGQAISARSAGYNGQLVVRGDWSQIMRHSYVFAAEDDQRLRAASAAWSRLTPKRHGWPDEEFAAPGGA